MSESPEGAAEKRPRGRPRGSGWRQQILAQVERDQTILNEGVPDFQALLAEECKPTEESYLARLRAIERTLVRTLRKAEMTRDSGTVLAAARQLHAIAEALARFAGCYDRGTGSDGQPITIQLVRIDPPPTGPVVHIGRAATSRA